MTRTERPRNRLLAALPPDVFLRLAADLQTIPMTVKQTLHRQGRAIEQVFFPNGGMASITTMLGDGTMVESGTVGDEGMVGIEAFFVGDPIAPGESMVQVPDTSLETLPVAAFRRELARNGPLQDLMGRYAQNLVAQMMHAGACNALHHVQQRCCRWLLMIHDRVHQDTFALSHEFLAVMLGTRRPTVTSVAGALQKAGLIRYTRGQITVVDRPGLEKASCECYASIRKQFDAVFDR